MVGLIFGFVKLHAPAFAWIVFGCMMIAATVYTVYLYRMYHKNTATIRQNLEELSEWKEE
jgi:O-antigen/teichoic acid export membrane protein